MQKPVGADSPEAVKRVHNHRRREAERDRPCAAKMAFSRTGGAAGIRKVVPLVGELAAYN